MKIFKELRYGKGRSKVRPGDIKDEPKGLVPAPTDSQNETMDLTTGSDDERDALDRRVEIIPIDCEDL